MPNQTLDDKIKEAFGEFAIDKALVKHLGISGDDRHVPSYVMDWIVTYMSKKNSSTTNLQKAIQDFVRDHLPSKSEKEIVKYRLSQGATLTILDAVSVEVKLANPVQYRAAIPCLDENKAKIEEDLIAQNQGLLQGSLWGAIKIVHDELDEGGIRIIDFKPMQTGRISLDALVDCRANFTVEEWMDVIIRTMGYEPSQYSEREKLWMLCRLIPVVHNRVNMMELAPPGSGKSYVYNNISRHVWLTSAQISPPVLFYNRQSHRPGLLTRYDLLVLDEAQSIKFTDGAEIQAQLKGYLEQGVYSRGDVCATAECGLVLLANIGLQQGKDKFYGDGRPAFLPERRDYIRRLPDVFLESPLLDRFHGILPGWEIPPFSTKQQARGFGLKADYFAEVCHSMRTATHLSQMVRSRLCLSGGKRDCTAVERLACGLAKLLLIGPDHPRFDDLVMAPALEMRRLVRTQLHELDPHGFSAKLDIRLKNVLEEIGQYELLEEIGRGGMACVYRGRSKTDGQNVAIKMVRKQGTSVDQSAIRREIDIYRRLKAIPNENLLSVIDISFENDKYMLVTEYADGGSVWDLIGGDIPDEERKPLDDGTTQEIGLAILDGLIALHENDIVHRDVKPQNILRCDDKWKIADFGISKFVSSPSTVHTFAGAFSTPWAPPEQMQGAAAHPSADIYAFGRTIGFLLSGSRAEAKMAELPQKWADVLMPCISPVPAERPNAKSLRDEFAGLCVAP